MMVESQLSCTAPCDCMGRPMPLQKIKLSRKDDFIKRELSHNPLSIVDTAKYLHAHFYKILNKKLHSFFRRKDDLGSKKEERHNLPSHHILYILYFVLQFFWFLAFLSLQWIDFSTSEKSNMFGSSAAKYTSNQGCVRGNEEIQ